MNIFDKKSTALAFRRFVGYESDVSCVASFFVICGTGTVYYWHAGKITIAYKQHITKYRDLVE